MLIYTARNGVMHKVLGRRDLQSVGQPGYNLKRLPACLSDLTHFAADRVRVANSIVRHRVVVPSQAILLFDEKIQDNNDRKLQVCNRTSAVW